MSSFEEVATSILGVDFQQALVYLDHDTMTWYVQAGMSHALTSDNRLDAQIEAAAWIVSDLHKRIISVWIYSGADENGSYAVYA